jgi:putative ABC transport system substrate-binding protein
MKRREFIAGLGSAVAWPHVARAQQTAMPVIGYLSARSADADMAFTTAFRKGLSEIGYVPRRNVAIDYRWAAGQYNQLPTLAADLVRRQVAVIAAVGGSSPALAAKAVTTTIPIVFQTGDDPVRVGLVASLNRPGSNVTGVTSLNAEVVPKRLELLHELLPAANIMALLVNQTDSNAEALTNDAQAAARALGLHLHVRCLHRRRLQHGFCNPGPSWCKRARDQPRSILRSPQRTARGPLRSAFDARDLRNDRLLSRCEVAPGRLSVRARQRWHACRESVIL